MCEVKRVEIVLDVAIAGDIGAGAKNMRVIVDPALAADHVSDWLRFVEERRAVLTEKDEFLIEDVVVDPSNLPGRAVVRHVAGTHRTLLRVDGLAAAVEN